VVEHADYRDDPDTRWRLRTGRHKRRIAVNLREPRGQDLVRALASKADAFAENFRPGVMDRYRLGYADLSALNQRLVYLSISGFGHQEVLPTPYKDMASYGPIAEAVSGVTASQGPRQGAYTIAMGDVITTLFATIGLMVALRGRDRDGRGQYVDL